jgi:hypothetical protein
MGRISCGRAGGSGGVEGLRDVIKELLLIF